MSALREYTFLTTDQDTAELLAAVLGEEGFDGFDLSSSETKAYYSGEGNEPDIHSILADYPVLSHIPFSLKILPDTNWNAVWESDFQPVVIAGRLGIRATFHEPLPLPLQLQIQPRMSFGTGHHPTTRMMIQAMLDLDLKGKKVLDTGCGTGILTLVALKLGADSVLATDNEEQAVSNTLDHLQLNELSGAEVRLTDSLEQIAGPFELILGNINRHIILRFLPDWYKLAGKNAILLLSGLLTEDEEMVCKAASDAGFVFTGRQEESGWIQLTFNRP